MTDVDEASDASGEGSSSRRRRAAITAIGVAVVLVAIAGLAWALFFTGPSADELAEAVEDVQRPSDWELVKRETTGRGFCPDGDCPSVLEEYLAEVDRDLVGGELVAMLENAGFEIVEPPDQPCDFPPNVAESSSGSLCATVAVRGDVEIRASVRSPAMARRQFDLPSSDERHVVSLYATSA